MHQFHQDVIDAVRCPKCTAEAGEPCMFDSSLRGRHYDRGDIHREERVAAYEALRRGEPFASAHCWLCGRDTPHAHTNDELAADGQYITVRLPAQLILKVWNGLFESGMAFRRIEFFLRHAWDEYDRQRKGGHRG